MEMKTKIIKGYRGKGKSEHLLPKFKICRTTVKATLAIIIKQALINETDKESPKINPQRNVNPFSTKGAEGFNREE